MVVALLPFAPLVQERPHIVEVIGRNLLHGMVAPVDEPVQLPADREVLPAAEVCKVVGQVHVLPVVPVGAEREVRVERADPGSGRPVHQDERPFTPFADRKLDHVEEGFPVPGPDRRAERGYPLDRAADDETVFVLGIRVVGEMVPAEDVGEEVVAVLGRVLRVVAGEDIPVGHGHGPELRDLQHTVPLPL